MPTPSNHPNITAYRRDIDGLRAIAVSAVVLYHSFPKFLTGGFCGVDIFFVISGYLISGHIESSLAAGNFSFAAFYGRRIRRIFPGLTLVLAFCLIFGFVVLLPSELTSLGADIAGGAGFLSNILLWNEAGYFDRSALVKPLLHLWSLGVEEQFYIIWPAALWLVCRTRLNLAMFIAIICAASFALNVSQSLTDSTADFYSPLTRFWELAVGALLAACPRSTTRMPSWLADTASVGGCLLILSVIVLLNQAQPFPGWRAIFPVLGATMIIAAGPAALINRSVLSSRVAVFIGLISYPLYLWHWSLISYGYIIRAGRPAKTAPAVAIIFLSVLLAWLTFKYFETPLRFGSARRLNTVSLVLAMLILGASGAVTWRAGGFPSRYAGLPTLDISKVNAAIHDGIFQPTPGMKVLDKNKIEIARIGSGTPPVLFTGDSVLFQYGPRMQYLQDRGKLHRQVIFVAGASCAPVPGVTKTGLFAYCGTMPEIAQSVITRENPSTIVIGALWQGYFGKDVFVTRNGMTMPIDTQTAVDAFYANLQDELNALVKSHHRVYLILAVPSSPRFNPELMVKRSLMGVKVDPNVLKGLPRAVLQADLASTNARLTAIAQATGAQILNPLPDICGPTPVCSAFFDNGEPKFADSMHLRPWFVSEHMQFLDDVVGSR